VSNYLTPKQLAERLNVSRSTISRMLAGGELPDPIKTGRRFVRISEVDVELWEALNYPSAVDFRKLKKAKTRFAKRNGRQTS